MEVARPRTESAMTIRRRARPSMAVQNRRDAPAAMTWARVRSLFGAPGSVR
jgi:hypothetical protein